MADESEGQNGDGVSCLKPQNTAKVRGGGTHPNGPGGAIAGEIRAGFPNHERGNQKRAANLSVHGEHFGLAEVVRPVEDGVVVTQGDVAVLFIQRTRDVESLVDHLWRRRSGVHRGPTLPSGGGGGGSPSPKLTEIRKNTIQEREKPLV